MKLNIDVITRTAADIVNIDEDEDEYVWTQDGITLIISKKTCMMDI